MQQEKQKKSPIKRRILQVIELYDISKREFYSKTGISRGTLDNYTGITEDTITKFFATYKNINPMWLITGEGDMFLSKSEDAKMEVESYDKLILECNTKANKIIELMEEINKLKEEITELKNK